MALPRTPELGGGAERGADTPQADWGAITPWLKNRQA